MGLQSLHLTLHATLEHHVEAAGKAAVRRDDDEQHVLLDRVLDEKGLALVEGRVHDVCEHALDGVLVGRGLLGTVERLADLCGGDHLHRTRDLHGRLHRGHAP